MAENANIYYPYDEVKTVLLPVAEGCPYNKCSFCAMYKGCDYEEAAMREVEQVLLNADLYTERIFLTGADPLYIGYEKMLCILEKIRKHLPYCACVAAYASVRSVSKYSEEQLKNLHNAGLRLLYIGFESGSDKVLKRIRKGHTAEQAVLQAQKLNQAHIMFHTIVMYGIAGRGNGVENALLTAQMVNRFHSGKIITMNYTVFEFSEMAEWIRDGSFEEASPQEKCLELRTFFEHLSPDCAVELDTTHPTNLLKMRGKLKDGLEDMISRCNAVIGKQNV